MPDATSCLTVGCQAVVAVTFARSCAAKAGRAAFADFRRWLTTGVRIPPSAAAPLAVAAVAAEGVTAVAVLVSPLAPAGFAAAAVLLGVFTAVTVSMIRRRVRVPCRCFGAGRRPPGAPHLARNVVLLLAAAVGGVTALTGTGPPPLGPVPVLAAVAGAAVALLLIELEEIVTLVRPVVPDGRT
ncbi:hypothetical protein SAMN04489712_10767 [Thermomonospora echinospora]|uniref:Methylamine utilisation protein MauE domain-containing protein n=1 Tax=Thermomonospora echinospora TaxID=1992 RepID=A0A1H6BF58_9ACTN|nr:MauE/DoxX family redox-associated membrane protein [Thermomonospora echinospora]SEG59413.1 hypothetical protein SAMN04489712_10767 [Thermomonospora echinospora]